MNPNRVNPESTVDVSGHVLARNTLINMAGQIVPLLVAIASLPYVIHHLGPDRFGLLSLAWMVVGYFALFNLGIGPATTKFVAELLGKGEIEKLPELAWTAFLTQTCFGLVAGLLLAIASPMLVARVLKIPIDLHGQAQLIFLIMSATLPIDFASGSMGGVLGASQRFDLVNAVSVPSGVLNYLLPILALALGYGLPAIVFFLALTRLAGLLIQVVLCVRLYPSLRTRVCFNRKLVRSLLGFGGWVTVSSIAIPIFVYSERFIIGSVNSVAALTYYTAPFMVASKTTVLAGSIAAAFFPYASYFGLREASRVSDASLKSCKYLLLILTPVLVIFLLFSHRILALWLGSAFADRSAVTLQVLIAGFFLNSFAMIPYTSVQALGRPDLKAKLDVAGVPFYLLTCWLLVAHFGIVGAAWAKLIITVIDTVALFLMAHRIGGLLVDGLAFRQTMRATALAGALVISAFAVQFLHFSLPFRILATGFLLFTYAAFHARVAMEHGEFRSALGVLQRWGNPMAAGAGAAGSDE